MPALVDTSPQEASSLRRSMGFSALLAVAAFVFNWIATSPTRLVHINWDAGGYVHGIGSNWLNWSTPPWNAHFALHWVYLAFCSAARLFGGTPVDGLRLLGSVCLGTIAGALSFSVLSLSRSRLIAGLLVATWAVEFVTQFLIHTLEDNLVFLAPATLTLLVCAVRFREWGAREAMVAGVLVGLSGLMSTQGVLHILGVVYLALAMPGRARPLRVRLLHAGLSVASLLATQLGFVLAIAATSDLGLRRLLGIYFSRPEPSAFPNSLAELATLLGDVSGSFRSLGLAASYHLFQNSVPFSSPGSLVFLGVALFVVCLLVFILGTVRGIRRQGWELHYFSAILLGMVVLTALYRDVDYAYLKRTDFLPIVGILVIAAGVRPGLRKGWRRTAFVSVVGATIAYQAVADWRWHRAEAKSWVTLDRTVLQRSVPGYHGIPGEGSFFGHFRGLRKANPQACSFVFDASELVHGRWNSDLTGSIWSELPSHIVLGPPDMLTWPRVMRVQNPKEAKRTLRGCEWISHPARKTLQAF